MVTIRERNTTQSSNTVRGSNGINVDFGSTEIGSNPNTPTVTGQGDQVNLSYNAINQQLGKQDEFNLDAGNKRVREQSYLALNRDLNIIKQNNESGQLAELLSKVNYNNDRGVSWGYALAEILDEAKITRNGEKLTPSKLAEALKNDKDGKIKAEISKAINKIQSDGTFKKELELAKDKHDSELVTTGTLAVSAAAATPVGKKVIAGVATKALPTLGKVGGLLLKGSRFMAFTPQGLAISAGLMAATWALNNTEIGKDIKAATLDPLGNAIGSVAGNIGDRVGYQVSKLV